MTWQFSTIINLPCSYLLPLFLSRFKNLKKNSQSPSRGQHHFRFVKRRKTISYAATETTKGLLVEFNHNFGLDIAAGWTEQHFRKKIKLIIQFETEIVGNKYGSTVQKQFGFHVSFYMLRVNKDWSYVCVWHNGYISSLNIKYMVK